MAAAALRHGRQCSCFVGPAATVVKATEPDGDAEKRPQVDPQQLNALLQEFQDLEQDPALPEPRSVDHSIKLQPGSGPQTGPIFRLVPKELDELKKQLEDLLSKGLIESSASPFDAPVLSVKKKDYVFLRGSLLPPKIPSMLSAGVKTFP